MKYALLGLHGAGYIISIVVMRGKGGEDNTWTMTYIIYLHIYLYICT